MEIKELNEQIRACQKCEICKKIKNKVIGRGMLKPKVLFLGEAPGKTEDEKGIPFCGMSGKLLEEWIDFLGVRDSFAIINVCKCRPYQVADETKDRPPTDDEIKNCHSFLDEQIKLLEPQNIILLGKTAIKALLPNISSDTILDKAGTFIDKYYILPHPAYFLRGKRDEAQKYLEEYKKFLLGTKFTAPVQRNFQSAEEYSEEESDEEEKPKIYLKNLVLNWQKAENLSKFEMISPALAAVHHFCKLGSNFFKDINTVDTCMIDKNKIKVVIRKADTGMDFVINEGEWEKSEFDYWLIGFKEQGNVIYMGWIDKKLISDTPARDIFGKGSLSRAVRPSNFIAIDTLIKVEQQEVKEEANIKLQPFAHLHQHTEYSIQDGYGTVTYIAEQLKKKGFVAAGITDHGTLSGTIYFQKACLEQGIKPILGIEAYVILKPTQEDKEQDRYHLCIFAKDKTGWLRLLELQEKAVRENFYYKPRFLVDDILAQPQGLIISTACQQGILAKHFFSNNYIEAERLAVLFKEKFGDDFYIELMPNRMPEQFMANQKLLEIAKKFNIKYIVTADVHYSNKEDEKYHKAVKAIGYNKSYNESGFSDNTFYLLTEDEIRELFKTYHSYMSSAMIDEAFNNTVEIMNKCNFQIEFKIEDTLPNIMSFVPELSIYSEFQEWLAKAKENPAELILSNHEPVENE